MPRVGFTTIALKPITNERLQKMTDQMHSMFIPSTLIMLMNEIRNGEYNICSHGLSLDLPGNYISITIRNDVNEWLRQKFKEFAKEYKEKYQAKHFTKFMNYFILNMLESKIDSKIQSVNLDQSNFVWLQKKYQKQKKNLQGLTFEEFTNIYIRNLFSEIDKEKI